MFYCTCVDACNKTKPQFVLLPFYFTFIAVVRATLAELNISGDIILSGKLFGGTVVVSQCSPCNQNLVSAGSTQTLSIQTCSLKMTLISPLVMATITSTNQNIYGGIFLVIV